MFYLNGKTALVTGATGGIGGAIARALHRQGATVAISGTRREVLDQLAGELGGRVHVLPCNLADKDDVEKLVPTAEEQMQKLDILVANAAINKDNLFVQLRDEDWDNVIAVNLTSTFRLVRAATKTMMRRRFGRLIGITSVVGVTGNAGQGNYTAAKAGMIGMFKSVAQEYAKRGVTANCIAPGFIATSSMKSNASRFSAGCPRGGWAAARISLRRPSISPPTRRATSPAKRCISTAGWP